MLRRLESDLSQMTPPIAYTDQALYERFFSILDRTTNAKKADVRLTRSSELETAFGRRLFELLSVPIGFRRSWLRCCSSTEPFLYEALVGPEAEIEGQSGPLLLVMVDRTVVAVQKNVGDPSVYPLVDKPSLGLFCGTIATPIRYIQPAMIEADYDSVIKVPANEYIGFMPRRMASTAVDEEIRTELLTALRDASPGKQNGLSLSHEQLVAAAQDKLAGATWYKPSLLKPPY